MIYGHQGEIWSRNKKMGGIQNKSKFLLQEKLDLETEGTLERTHSIEKKEEEKRRTIIAIFLNYKERANLKDQIS